MTTTENSNSLSCRQMARLLKKMKIGNGDILAIRFQSPEANVQTIDLITKGLEQINVSALVIVVNDFDDLTVLNETEMNKRGWYHLSSISRVIKIPEKEAKSE